MTTEHDNFGHFTYSVARKAAAEALGLAARVYVQVEKTQKDVLFGVLFYIALFVPFAFVMERFLFNFATIYKRIVGFSLILVSAYTIIYNVHPAFRTGLQSHGGDFSLFHHRTLLYGDPDHFFSL